MKPALARAVASHRSRFLDEEAGFTLNENRLDLLAQCAEEHARKRNLEGLVHVAAHDVPELIEELVRLKEIT